MPIIRINQLDHYYELSGNGPPLMLVHGAFADSSIWDPQWDHFQSNYRLVRFDLRGHGRTGASGLARYSIDTFADDLRSLLDGLDIHAALICGQSWGGSISQAFACLYPERVRALILAGSAVAIDPTLMDKLLCNILFPRWLMLFTIRVLSVRNFVRFSLWLARRVRGEQWLSRQENASELLEQCMLAIDSREYLKIWGAIYGFHLQPLENISCPTLVLNGEFEPRSTFHHTRTILQYVANARAKIVPSAGHASNLDNPAAFNQLLEDFLNSLPPAETS
jgi:pimeloyl-ACP methyl ester carboxylesterase